VDATRIDLKDGQHWEIKSRLTRGDVRAIDRHVRREALKMVGELKESGVTQEEIASMASPRDGIHAAPVVANPDEEDARLMHGSVSWSFPGDITFDSIQDRDADDVDTVLAVMVRLYDHTPEESENLNGKQPLPFSMELDSPVF
jgi:hypothetical protein